MKCGQFLLRIAAIDRVTIAMYMTLRRQADELNGTLIILIKGVSITGLIIKHRKNSGKWQVFKSGRTITKLENGERH